MKKIAFIFIAGFIIYSCSTTTTTTSINKSDSISSNSTSDTLRIANEELEYEILIIEPGFNAWLATQQPRGYYSENFLEIRNRQYVFAYNQRVIQPQRFDPNLYMQTINYQPTIKYGYEVNYLLYNYFLYFERTFKQSFSISRQ